MIIKMVLLFSFIFVFIFVFNLIYFFLIILIFKNLHSLILHINKVFLSSFVINPRKALLYIQ